MNTAQAVGPVYALLADGSTVEIRPAGTADFDAVKAMHEAMSPDNSYLRFFNISRRSAEIEARRICRDPAPGSLALLAVADGELVADRHDAPDVPDLGHEFVTEVRALQVAAYGDHAIADHDYE